MWGTQKPWRMEQRRLLPTEGVRGHGLDSPVKEAMALPKPRPPVHPPPRPGRGAPLPIELRRGLSRQHCPDS